MSQVIIYAQDSGVVAIIRPTEDALAVYGIDAIARKDVPSGKRYKIIDASAIPTDRTFRSAWEVDEVELTDGIGAESNEFQVVT